MNAWHRYQESRKIPRSRTWRWPIGEQRKSLIAETEKPGPVGRDCRNSLRGNRCAGRCGCEHMMTSDTTRHAPRPSLSSKCRRSVHVRWASCINLCPRRTMAGRDRARGHAGVRDKGETLDEYGSKHAPIF
jgi:hypothetical protein